MNSYKTLPEVKLVDLLDAYDDYIQSASSSDLLESGWKPKSVQDFYNDEYQDIWLAGGDFGYLKDLAAEYKAGNKIVNDPLMDFIKDEVPLRLEEVLEIDASPEMVAFIVDELQKDTDVLFDYDQIDDFIMEKVDEFQGELLEDVSLDEFNDIFDTEFETMPDALCVRLPDDTVLHAYKKPEDVERSVPNISASFYLETYPADAKNRNSMMDNLEFTGCINVIDAVSEYLSDIDLELEDVSVFHSLDQVFSENKERQGHLPLNQMIQNIESKQEKSTSISSPKRDMNR